MVKDGYGSASEVVREGLRLVEEREAKLVALRATLDASIAQGGEVTDDDLDAALAEKSAERRPTGEMLIAAMQASPYRDLDITPNRKPRRPKQG